MQRNSSVDAFLARYITPPSGRSPQTTKSRIMRWIQIANNPSEVAPPNTSEKDIAKLRRKARQNVRRLAEAHPDVAAEIMAAAKPVVTR
jgi:hypothetical protein